MKITFACILVTAGMIAPAFGQRLSFGVVGGTSLTGDFRTLRNNWSFQGSSYTDISESGPRRLIIGPMIELGLRSGWSVEVNALHRTLGYTVRTDFPGRICGVDTFCGADMSTWQFPVLAKYRISVRRVNPFVTLGPSFRTYSSPAGTRPSAYGITGGAGVEWNAGRFFFAPTVRYTRWRGEEAPFRPTIRNQVEILGGIGYRTDAAARTPFGRKIWLGLMVGTPLTNDFPLESPDAPAYTGEVRRAADFRSVAGLMAEVEIGRGASIEVNGLYRRLHFESGPEVVVTWQIPVLLKQTFGGGPLRPFVQGGPSFRLAGNLNNTDPARYGVTAGVGLEGRWRRLRLTPSLRYTRWAEDNRAFIVPQALTKRDQIELLAGFSF